MSTRNTSTVLIVEVLILRYTIVRRHGTDPKSQVESLLVTTTVSSHVMILLSLDRDWVRRKGCSLSQQFY